jgi:membrane fusion protein (multidrug efflux system)
MVYWNNSARRSLGMSESTVFEGTMQPVMEVRVTALVPGIVAMVSAHVGDPVNEGDVLVTMDSHEAEVEVAKAQLAYDAVQRNLAKLRGDLARTEVNVAAAIREAANVPSRQVRDSVQHARAVYDQALTDYQRNEELYSLGVIAKQVLDNSATALRIARDDLENAHRGETANREVQQLQGKQGELLSQISQREQLDQVKVARLALQSASARLANTKVRATSSGVVCAVSVKVGDQVSVGAPLVVVSRMDRITVNVPVAASMIASLHKFQQAQIILPTMPPQRVLGAIRAISPVPSANMTHNVEVEFDNPTGQLLTGQPAQVRFVFE